jgi:hypothetical protein
LWKTIHDTVMNCRSEAAVAQAAQVKLQQNRKWTIANFTESVLSLFKIRRVKSIVLWLDRSEHIELLDKDLLDKLIWSSKVCLQV